MNQQTSSSKNTKEKKSLTRFNVIYEDPYKIFLQYLKGEISLYDIGNKCKNCQIYPEFRSILYRIFLGILPYDKPGEWKNSMKQKREAYEVKLNSLLSKSEHIIPFINCHFLKGSKDYENLRKFIPEEDKDLLSLIKLDVDRTFQDLDLFHDDKVKEILCKILYVFSKDNPDPSYCQGMNEILGTLFYSFLSSFRFNKFTKEEQNENNNGKITNEEMLYYYLVDNNFIEADLFIIYSELMSRNMTVLYMYNDDRFRKKESEIKYDIKNLKEEDLKNSGESDLYKRIKTIFYIYLPKIDKKYFDFLVDSLEPNLFLLRWLLCILDREISLKHVLWLWDCIIFYEFVEFTFIKKDVDVGDASIKRLNFLDMVCLAMIKDLKPLVMNNDQSIMLCRFMKFPDEKNIRQIIKESINLSNQFNSDNKIWNYNDLRKTVNYLENK
jgi:TBC1 domain family protein 5